MADDLQWLFGSSTPQTFLNPTTANSTLPQWYTDAQVALLGKASGIANQPYALNPNPRVAGLDPLQQQAVNEAPYVGNVGGTDLGHAGALAYNAGNTQFDPNQFQQFMNPYTDDVVNREAELGQRNLTENLLPSINSSFTGAGQFGSTRHGDFTEKALRDTNESILGQQANTLQTSEDQAMTAYQNALQRQAQSGGILAGIGTGQTQNEIQSGGYQALTGAIPQALAQQNLDVANQDFQNQVNYPLQQLSVVNDTLKGISPYQDKIITGTSGTQLPAASNTNGAGTALGALASFFGSK